MVKRASKVTTALLPNTMTSRMYGSPDFNKVFLLSCKGYNTSGFFYKCLHLGLPFANMHRSAQECTCILSSRQLK